MDEDFCMTCTGPKIPDCAECVYNQGIIERAGRVEGPCGQQNCWYGCTVCAYNGYAFYNRE